MAGRRHVPGVERALPPRPLARRDGGRRARPRLVRHPAPHRGRGPARGTTSPPGCTATSSGTTGRRRWPSTGSPTAAGRPATTAGCAPATRSSTSWPRAVPPAGGSQGTGQDLAVGGRRCRCGSSASGRAAPRWGASEGFPVRVALHQAGPVRFISHRDMARAFERAFRIEQLPLVFTQGFSPRPKVSFGLALSVGYESDAEYLDVELREPSIPTRLRRAAVRRTARGHRRDRRRAARRPRPRAAGVGHARRVPGDRLGCRRRDRRLRSAQASVDRPLAQPPRSRSRVTRKGQRDAPTTSARIRSIGSATTDGASRPLELALTTQPAVPVLVRCSTPFGRRLVLAERRVLRTAPMDRARRRAAGAARRRRAHARPGGARVMREGTNVRRHDPGGGHRPDPAAAPSPPRGRAARRPALRRVPAAGGCTRRRRGRPTAPPPASTPRLRGGRNRRRKPASAARRRATATTPQPTTTTRPETGSTSTGPRPTTPTRRRGRRADEPDASSPRTTPTRPPTAA